MAPHNLHNTVVIDELVWTAYTAKLSQEAQKIESANEQIKAQWNAGRISIFLPA